MANISELRCVLLSGAYADTDNREVKSCFRGIAHKSAGFVEVTLDDGTTGVGEGYMAVFAPRVFEQIVAVIRPYLIGRSADDIVARVRDVNQVCDYWSLQGAARHVLSAIEIALVDARAKQLDVPAYALFGGAKVKSIPLYGSGGDYDTPESQQAELDRARALGLKLFKTRGRNWETRRTAWMLRRAAAMGIDVGVDMAQNLANPGQSVSDVVDFVRRVEERSGSTIRFLEEPLGPLDIDNFRLLRSKVAAQVCGGETVTTPFELAQRIAAGSYDFVQPDATVIGGISAVMEVFAAGRNHGCPTVVHAWGAAPCLMANYHAAFAGGSTLAEYPMPSFELRESLFAEPLRIVDGQIQAPRAPGIGVRLTPEIEQRFHFRDEAVYSCLAPQPGTWSSDASWE